MLKFRIKEFTTGLYDSFSLRESLKSSRTLSAIALRMLPIFMTVSCVGLWFHGIEHLVGDDWAQRLVLWCIWTCFLNIHIFN